MDLPIDIIVPAFVGVAVLLLILGLSDIMSSSARRRSRRDGSGRAWRPRLVHDHRSTALPSRTPDAADQLRTVELSDYRSQPSLRFQERLVFAAAEAAVRAAGVNWRVFAQVSLGEVLTCYDDEGFKAINAKRVDFLLTDHNFQPLAAIEYQGSGHHIGRAAARDAVKKEALRKGGIGFIEVTADHRPDDLAREIQRLVLARSGA